MNRSMLNGFRSSVGVGQQNFYNQDQRSNSMYNSPYNKGGNLNAPQTTPPVKPGYQSPVMPQLSGTKPIGSARGGSYQESLHSYRDEQGNLRLNQPDGMNATMDGTKPQYYAGQTNAPSQETMSNPEWYGGGGAQKPQYDDASGGAPVSGPNAPQPVAFGQPGGATSQPSMPQFSRLNPSYSPRANYRPPAWTPAMMRQARGVQPRPVAGNGPVGGFLDPDPYVGA